MRAAPIMKDQPASLSTNSKQVTLSFFYSFLDNGLYLPQSQHLRSANRQSSYPGANSGLCFEAVRKFTILGASTMILACRPFAEDEGAAKPMM